MSIEEDIFKNFDKRSKEMSEEFDKDQKITHYNHNAHNSYDYNDCGAYVVIALNADKIYNSAKASIIHEIKDVKKQLNEKE